MLRSSPSWTSSSTAPPSVDMMARGLAPRPRASIFACMRPSSASNPATSDSSGNARTPVKSTRRAWLGSAPDASTTTVPWICPPYTPVRVTPAVSTPLARIAPTDIGAKRNLSMRSSAAEICASASKKFSPSRLTGLSLQGWSRPAGAPGFAEAAPPVTARSRRWKSRSILTTGLLAKSTETNPLNLFGPIVPASDLIVSSDPFVLTSALPRAASCSKPGASTVNSSPAPCPSSRPAGSLPLSSTRKTCSPR